MFTTSLTAQSDPLRSEGGARVTAGPNLGLIPRIHLQSVSQLTEDTVVKERGGGGPGQAWLWKDRCERKKKEEGLALDEEGKEFTVTVGGESAFPPWASQLHYLFVCMPVECSVSNKQRRLMEI